MTQVARADEPPFDAELAVKGFFRDPEWMFKIGIGQVINASILLLGMANPLMFPVLLAFMSLTTGYALRMVRFRALSIEDKLPEWNEWLELVVSGLTWLALQFGFWSLVSGVATILYMCASRFSNDSTEGAWIVGSVLAVIFCALVVSFYTSYLMVNFALEESIKSGFALREVTKRLFSNPRALVGAWLLALGLPGAALVLPCLTVIGVFFVPATLFAASVMAADVLAQAWLGLDKPGSRTLKRPPPKAPDGRPDQPQLPQPSGTKRSQS
jgi:hypothetical protein